jgi:uncharacterized protein YfbU (UPF0304 family)
MIEDKDYLKNLPTSIDDEDDEDTNKYASSKKRCKVKTPVLDTYSRDLTKWQKRVE